MEDRSEPENVGTIHGASVAAHPQRLAFVDARSGTTYSYEAFAAAVNRAANVLASLSVTRRDRVVLLYENSVRYVSLLFGAMRLGSVPVPVNWRLPTHQLEYVLADSGASVAALTGDPSVREAVLPALKSTPALSTIGFHGPAPDGLAERSLVSLPDAFREAEPTHRPAPVERDDPALQPYTSGSSGRPKGVVLTHGGVGWNTEAFVDHLSLDGSERALVVTPLYHKNAMTGAVKPMLATGGSTVITAEFDAERALDCIERYEVTYLTGVPVIYKRLLAAADPTDDVDSLQWASCGSATVPASLRESFVETFDADLLEVYGLTEGGPVVTHSLRDGRRKRGSAGITLPGVETRVVDPETGRERQPGDPGELVVSNPGVAEYASDDTPPLSTVEGKQFLHTGDFVRVDEEGYHFVLGRLDDMLVVGGENVYPAEVEDVLQRHDAVDDVAVVGVPHAEKGTVPVAFVVSARDISAEGLRAHALDVGSAYAHPRRVYFCDSLPQAGTGKVDREALETLARRRVGGQL